MDSRQKLSDSLSDVNTSDVFNVFNSMGMFFLEISIYTECRSFFTRTECNSKWLCTSVLHVQLRNLFTNIALLLIGDYYKSSMNHSPIELPRETCVEIKNAQRVNILGSIGTHKLTRRVKLQISSWVKRSNQFVRRSIRANFRPSLIGDRRHVVQRYVSKGEGRC